MARNLIRRNEDVGGAATLRLSHGYFQLGLRFPDRLISNDVIDWTVELDVSARRPPVQLDAADTCVK